MNETKRQRNGGRQIFFLHSPNDSVSLRCGVRSLGYAALACDYSIGNAGFFRQNFYSFYAYECRKNRKLDFYSRDSQKCRLNRDNVTLFEKVEIFIRFCRQFLRHIVVVVVRFVRFRCLSLRCCQWTGRRVFFTFCVPKCVFTLNLPT